MEIPNKEDPVFVSRGSRLTRGKRMTKLLDDEVKEDESFWNQDALKDEEHDDNYEEEEEVVDEFDSDFNDDEPEPDEAEDNAEERISKKRLIFPGKTASDKKKKKKKEVVSELVHVDVENKCSEGVPLENQDASDGVESERVVRKSTRTSVIVRQAERDAMRAASQAAIKPAKRKKDGEERRMTQEEMLLEAAQTEIKNVRNLERVLAKEEEVKRRAVIQKTVYNGPQIRYFSKDGISCIELTNGVTFQSEISSNSVPYPERARCTITGLPAIYRDPKTGLPYATKEAFKIIRDRFSEENSVAAKKEVKGVLFDSISGQGFLNKKKRSVPHYARETSNFHYSSQFSRCLLSEDGDSE